MALTYTQDHNWWVQRVNKEIMASSRINMYNSQSLLNFPKRPSEQSIPALPKSSRPSTTKSVALSNRSLRQGIQSPKSNVIPLEPEMPVLSKNLPQPEDKILAESRPLSSRLSARSVKSKQSTASKPVEQRNGGRLPEDLKYDLERKSNGSVKSLASKADSYTLKSYIKELEDLLRQEKLKRIETEENLKRVITRSSWRSNE